MAPARLAHQHTVGGTGEDLHTKTRPAGQAAAKGAAAPLLITLSNSADPSLSLAPESTADTDAATKDETELDEPDRENNRLIRWAKLCDQVPESVYEKVTKLGVRGVYGRRVYRRDYPH